MNTDAMVVIGIAVAVVVGFAWMGRRMDQRRHQDKLERIQERIRRREQGSGEG
ncbi:MAG: hypothetical protein V2I66_00220 [Halieaceae bacterium]|nr:hypothetical protein [Halieaceae bacterium]